MPLLSNIALEVLATAIREEREIKGIQTGVKLSLFANDMILYIENPKDNTKKLLELINEFGKAEGFKINMQKLLYFYTLTTKLSEREIKTAIPSTTALKRTKYLEINLTYKVKVLYSENHDTNERN